MKRFEFHVEIKDDGNYDFGYKNDGMNLVYVMPFIDVLKLRLTAALNQKVTKDEYLHEGKEE